MPWSSAHATDLDNFLPGIDILERSNVLLEHFQLVKKVLILEPLLGWRKKQLLL